MIPGSASPLLLATAAAGGYSISRSVRFNSSDSAYLSRTPSTAGNRKKFTISFWVKRTALDGGTGPGDHSALFSAGSWTSDSDFFNILFLGSGSGAGINIGFLNFGMSTNATFRDLSAWYHFVCAVDTDQAVLNDRIKLYQNGIDLNLAVSASVTQGLSTAVNNTVIQAIGKGSGSNFYYLNGYLADFYIIDGQQLDPSSFGEFDDNGIWQPKAYTGSYGTNGFHLDFADNSTTAALGTDSSGRGNTWTVNNISVTAGAGNDSLVDVPTNGSEVDTGSGGQVRGNYCTWNPLNETTGTRTLTNGNLDAAISGGAGASGGFRLNSGKWYYEATINSTGSARMWVGWLDESFPRDRNDWSYGSKSILYASNAVKGTDNTSYGASYTAGDVIGCALDLSAGTATFYKNGVSQGTMGSSLGATNWRPLISTSDTAWSVSANFGQRPFAYTAPSGFKALCTANLPAPVVTKPNTVMDVKLYTGNGGTQTISGLGFSPDLVWIKSRSTTYNHYLVDQIRGTGVFLQSNSTGAEGSASNVVTSLGSESFSLGNSLAINDATATYAAWCWDAGSSTVTNTQGSISSQVRANASAGFSVVTYTGNGSAGATVGHGLGVAPSMLIIKRRNSTSDWAVYHGGLATPTTKWLSLNLTNAQRDATYPTTVWNSTAPTSALFTVGDDAVVNASGATYVSYCFAPVVGYSSFGSYTGNGSADGPFVFCNFQPRYLLLKQTNTARDWIVIDAARSPSNVSDDLLLPNSSGAEFSNNADNRVDFLSNGFKLRGADAGTNQSSGTYIYCAFAESPFQYARAR